MKHSTPPALQHLEPALERLAQEGLLRTRPAPLEPGTLSFCSNDYLGLASRTAAEIPPEPRAPLGAGASRLVSGERSQHVALERALADWLQVDDALTFTSGYASNLGTLAALIEPDDLVVSDALNHASLIDGIRLSRAHVAVVPHLDVHAVERALAGPRRGRAWVVTESYFSMDADTPALADLRALCDRAGAGLIVDEAHALGVLGPDGRGLCAEAGVAPDVTLGTLGKAFGVGGAFVAGCRPLVAWLWNRARTFVFSTGLSPVLAGAALAHFEIARREPHRREAVLRAAARFRAGLRTLGHEPLGHGPVIPLVVGDPGRAVTLAAQLRDRGVHVQAIRPPSVPPGTSRLRFTVTARHSDADIDRALGVLADLLRSP